MIEENEEEITRVAERFLTTPSSGIGDVLPEHKHLAVFLIGYAMTMRDYRKAQPLPGLLSGAIWTHLTILLANAVGVARRQHGEKFSMQQESLFEAFAALHRALLKSSGVKNPEPLHREVYRQLHSIMEGSSGGSLRVLQECFP